MPSFDDLHFADLKTLRPMLALVCKQSPIVTRPIEEVKDIELAFWAHEQDANWRRAYENIALSYNSKTSEKNREMKEEHERSRPDLIMAVILILGMGLFGYFFAGDGGDSPSGNCYGAGITKVCE